MVNRFLRTLFVFFALVFSTVAMEPELFSDLLRRVQREGFEDDQLTVFKTGLLNNTVTTAQVEKIVKSVHFGTGKLDMLQAVSKSLEDPENSMQVLSSFDWADEMKEAQIILKECQKAYPIKSANVEVGYMEAYPEADFNALLTTIKKQAFFDEKLVLLKNGFRDKVEGINHTQAIALLKEFPISYDKVKALKVIEKNILGLTTGNVIQILKSFDFSDDKLTTLAALKDLITTGGNLFFILDQFTFSKDKLKAYEILKDIKPRSTIYGLVKENPAMFVIDVSGSMDAKFSADGKTFSRLEFVASELQKVLTQQLTPNQKFNIMIFSSGVSLWKGDFVNATPENIASAVTFTSKLRADGGTNIYDALKRSFLFPTIDGLYFLTDGVPTAGKKTDIQAILADVQSWNKNRKIPIHTTAFLMGSFSSDNKSQSRKLMKELAQTSNGVYRAIETMEDAKKGVATSKNTTKSQQSSAQKKSSSQTPQDQTPHDPDFDVHVEINDPDMHMEIDIDTAGMSIDMDFPEDPFQ